MELNDYEKEHIDILRKLLPECVVLLKNESEFRVKNAGEVALYGSGVRNTIKGGTGSGEVNSRYFVTVEEAFKQAGFTITTKAWLDEYDVARGLAKKPFAKRLRAEAKEKHMNPILYSMGMIMPEPETDIPLSIGKNKDEEKLYDEELAIYVLSRISGEGNDRRAVHGDFMLTKSEIRDILFLNEKYEKFLLVLNVGGPVDLSPVSEIRNILLLSQLGVDTGTVLVDIILGRAYPSGKIATTWSAWDDYCNIGGFGNWEDTEYKEGIYVGYRYFDTVKKKAMFPFGFGLSFAKSEISVTNVEVNGTDLCLGVKVTNIGNDKVYEAEFSEAVPIKEVVQVYITQPSVELDQPFQILAGFEKTGELTHIGDSEELSIKIDLRSIASFDTKKAAYVLEKGDYYVRVGNSSVETHVCAVLKLDETVIVRQVKNLLGPVKIEDVVLERDIRAEEINEEVRHLEINSKAFETKVIDYNKPQNIDKTVSKLKTSQLISMSVGAFNPDGGLASIIGEASQKVCGAAGETSEAALSSGIPALVMSDGPAGIRLAKDYYEDEKGLHNTTNGLLDEMVDILGSGFSTALKLLNKKVPEDATIKHQYATAIPIGTAIAQSFNTKLAYICGDIVGDEMERLNVQLWLAPALNIHRNVLCGRNFEYYSEDPLVSGEMAAAITEGVQSHKNCGVTIKHFAANNQETNRYNNNSVVSERAMREIYLKGFEICIRKSKPASLMTSYNLLNGIHTSERRDLNEDILRSEFGYEGFVMTDWVVSTMKAGKKDKYESPIPHRVCNSGNDIFMPGSKREVKEITDAYKKGLVSRSQLEINISRVADVVRRLSKE